MHGTASSNIYGAIQIFSNSNIEKCTGSQSWAQLLSSWHMLQLTAHIVSFGCTPGVLEWDLQKLAYVQEGLLPLLSSPHH